MQVFQAPSYLGCWKPTPLAAAPGNWKREKCLGEPRDPEGWGWACPVQLQLPGDCGCMWVTGHRTWSQCRPQHYLALTPDPSLEPGSLQS